MKNWDWRLKAVAHEAVDDILKGVGYVGSFHEEAGPMNFALHIRRRSTVEEQEEFKARKERGEYNERLVAKGVV